MKNNKNTKRQKNERRKKSADTLLFSLVFFFSSVFLFFLPFLFFFSVSLFFFRFSFFSFLFFYSVSLFSFVPLFLFFIFSLKPFFFFNFFYDILSGLSYFLFLSRASHVFRRSPVFVKFPIHPFPLFLKGYRYSLFFSPKLSAVNLFPPLFSRFLQFVTRYSRGFFLFISQFEQFLFTVVYFHLLLFTAWFFSMRTRLQKLSVLKHFNKSSILFQSLKI